MVFSDWLSNESPILCDLNQMFELLTIESNVSCARKYYGDPWVVKETDVSSEEFF